MTSVIWAFLAALGGMLLYGVASIAQGYAASRASGPDVLRHPAYLLGLVCDALAWLCSLGALLALPLFVVQSLLAGSLAVTVLLARPLLHVPVTRRDGIAVAVVTAGLVLVSASAAAESHGEPPSWFTAAMLVAMVALVAVSAALYRHGPSVPLAVLGGLGFSGAALAARAAHIGEGEPSQYLGNPLTWSVVVFGAVGAVMYARALEKGAIGPATAAMWVVEVLVPGGIGVFVLGDAVREGWAIPALIGVALAVAACVALAQSPAQAVESGQPSSSST